MSLEFVFANFSLAPRALYFFLANLCAATVDILATAFFALLVSRKTSTPDPALAVRTLYCLRVLGGLLCNFFRLAHFAVSFR